MSDRNKDWHLWWCQSSSTRGQPPALHAGRGSCCTRSCREAPRSGTRTLIRVIPQSRSGHNGCCSRSRVLDQVSPLCYKSGRPRAGPKGKRDHTKGPRTSSLSPQILRGYSCNTVISHFMVMVIVSIRYKSSVRSALTYILTLSVTKLHPRFGYRLLTLRRGTAFSGGICHQKIPPSCVSHER